MFYYNLSDKRKRILLVKKRIPPCSKIYIDSILALRLKLCSRMDFFLVLTQYYWVGYYPVNLPIYSDLWNFYDIYIWMYCETKNLTLHTACAYWKKTREGREKRIRRSFLFILSCSQDNAIWQVWRMQIERYHAFLSSFFVYLLFYYSNVLVFSKNTTVAILVLVKYCVSL